MSPILAPHSLDLISHSETQTRRLGARLAEMLSPGDVLALVGELGTGKTRLAQGICRGLGITDPVVSPTFTLVNEYGGGRLPVFHIDLYRLDDAGETLTFGLEDYLYDEGISLIEWADRAAEFLPPNHLTIELHHMDETKRRIVMRPQGDYFINLIKEYKNATFTKS